MRARGTGRTGTERAKGPCPAGTPRRRPARGPRLRWRRRLRATRTGLVSCRSSPPPKYARERPCHARGRARRPSVILPLALRKPRASLEVWKFGGASLADAPAIARAASLIAAHRGPLVVVASALFGVTDLLLDGARRSAAGDARAASEAARGFY